MGYSPAALAQAVVWDRRWATFATSILSMSGRLQPDGWLMGK